MTSMLRVPSPGSSRLLERSVRISGSDESDQAAALSPASSTSCTLRNRSSGSISAASMPLVDGRRPTTLPCRRIATWRRTRGIEAGAVGSSGLGSRASSFSLSQRSTGQRRPVWPVGHPIRVRSEDEHGRVVGRLVSPPSSPAVVRPLTTARADHVPAHDPRADVRHSSRGEVVINPGRSTPTPMGLPERGRVEQPFVQL